MTQLSLPETGSTTFNILNVNVSLAITTYCHSHFMQYCTLHSLAGMKDLMVYYTWTYCSFVFHFSSKANIVEHHSAFRCWDTCYILMFWHELSVEIYFFFIAQGINQAFQKIIVLAVLTPSEPTHLYSS